MYRCLNLTLLALSFVVSSGLDAKQLNPTADELCALYQMDSQSADDPSVQQIRSLCETYTREKLQAKDRPLYNFRVAAPETCENEESCFIFRGGQPAPKETGEELLEFYRSRQLGFSVNKLRDQFSMDLVLNLRFDPHRLSFEESFGPKIPRIPLSGGEVIFRSELEQEIVENLGINWIHIPSIPEMEHFIGNFVPRLFTNEMDRAYVCRLPKNLEDGAEKHWLNDHDWYREHLDELESRGVFPILTSQYEDCRDWYERYGEKQVEDWAKEVQFTSSIANRIFQTLAKFLVRAEKKELRVFYHCSSGSDRVGRTSAYYEMYRRGITQEEVLAYRGPGSNSRLDLVLLSYLISQRAGGSVEYRFMIPDLNRMNLSPLYYAFVNENEEYFIPSIEQLKTF